MVAWARKLENCKAPKFSGMLACTRKLESTPKFSGMLACTRKLERTPDILTWLRGLEL